MMINNNPYNLPERPPNKPNRIYTEGNAQGYRVPDLVESTTPYSQYLARQTHHTQVSGNPKSALNI